jgi:hypothetical protein
MPVAFKVPAVAETLVAGNVVTVGELGVENVTGNPKPTPTEFEARAQT